MDFYRIRQTMIKNQGLKIYPDFRIGTYRDFMARGHSFYAIWDPDTGLWSQNELDVQRIVDDELDRHYEKVKDKFETDIFVEYMSSYKSGSWKNYTQWVKSLPDMYHPLDTKLIFSNQEVKREDYASKRLPYPLEPGDYSAWDELISTLYEPAEREKIEWAIGSIVAGASKSIQKFCVFYGEAGAGKSTILGIIEELFEGYCVNFDAKSLGSSRNMFATEAFKSNPLVGVQHDGDLSKIEDNTMLNSIVSHENMLMNEKYKSSYSSKVNAFLFMGTNKPVKITDAKSGIIRRLIDISPSGNKVPINRYFELMSRIRFELGAIAYHCRDVFENLGKHYYDAYRPVSMMFKTDVFFNFVEDSYLVFSQQPCVTLKQAYDIYKEYCQEANVEYKMPKYKFREELKNYFENYSERGRVDDKQVWNIYSGFLKDKFELIKKLDDGAGEEEIEVAEPTRMSLEASESLFDGMFKDCPAQYASSNETPLEKWSEVSTTLNDIDTHQLHYVKVPENHIVIDFDLKNSDGDKDQDLNLEAAAKWPPTYAEFSKGGAGVHLHYIYDGDPKKLSRVYSEGIEIKVFTGNSSLRRRLSKCNDLLIAHISSGLPLKGEKVINFKAVKSERSLREQVTRNLNKEIHPGTKPSIDFIYKILEDAYKSDLKYDLTDMRPKVLAFANNSSHQADYCVRLVAKMHFKSENYKSDPSIDYDDQRIVFFDVEVFPNLFLINWKYAGEDATCVRMINPTPSEVEQLIKMKLVGFNCRRYDNHILYARYLGYSNLELYNLSQKIVNGSRNAFFGEAYNISYTDVYDFASAANKISLKKWEIKLGIHHQELGLPWDQPVPESKWVQVAEYCDNDVISTEAVFNHLSGDWAARQILSKISGLSVNDTTNQHSARIIFGNDRHPQGKFVYTDLSEMFPGYTFDHGKSYYRDELVGEGGYVYAEPGMYTDVALLDIASMHPSSIEALNLFGPYTQRFIDIKQARIDIKHKDYELAKTVLDGKLAPFVEELESGTASYTNKDLAAALKTVINSVYGLTSAKFENPFKDPRNIDNIVAKRGALFMINLKHECLDRGWPVVHIKTDSIKLANATPEMIQFVVDYGKKYGYNFEHEATYDRMCIVNNSVYIAHSKWGDHAGEWTATGAQFAQPYVFKTLFSKEPIEFKDLCETKSVTSALYLDMNESLRDVTIEEGELANRVFNAKLDLTDPKQKKRLKRLNPDFEVISDDELKQAISEGHSYVFVGRVGSFCPIKKDYGGGLLVREKDGKYYAVTGTTGYRWLESETVELMNKQDDIDLSYYNSLVDDAINDISEYGDFEWFVSLEDPKEIIPPWCTKPELRDPDLTQCANCSENSTCGLLN